MMIKTRSIHVYATRMDYEPIFKQIEAVRRLKYVLCGAFASPNIASLNSALDITDLGISLSEHNIGGQRYLAVDRDAEIVVREVPQRRGGVYFFVDELQNSSAITFQPGGIYKPCCLISGSIGFGQSIRHPEAESLFSDFSLCLKERFTKVNSYWLGSEALKHLISGMRLTADVRSPESYDLRLPAVSTN